MGQPIVVIHKSAPRPGVVRFDANRTFTGMGHEHYLRGQPVTGTRPPDELARRLFDRGGVDEVHVYGNVVTVVLSRGHGPDGIDEVIEGLYTYYREGVTPAIP